MPTPSSPSPQQFTFFQGAGFDCGFVSFLQIDRAGNVNVSRLAKRPYLTAGVGGFIDITGAAAGWCSAAPSRPRGWTSIEDGRLVIRQEGKIQSSCPRSSRSLQRPRGRAQRQEVTIVTERCVLKQTEAG